MTTQWRPEPEPMLAAFGDVMVTPTRVYTPVGERPRHRVQWGFTDMTYTTREIPTWAIVLAIVFGVFALLGLLFLLAREERTTGTVMITVQGEGLYHVATLPVSSREQVIWYANMVHYVRSAGTRA